MSGKREPLIHTGITDRLPAEHPLAATFVCCEECGTPLHSSINESLDDWVETGRGNYCFQHFFALYEAWTLHDDGPDDAWGLPGQEAP